MSTHESAPCAATPDPPASGMPETPPAAPSVPPVPPDPSVRARFAAGLGRVAAGRLGGLPRDFWVLWAGTLVNRLGTMVEPFLAFYLTSGRGLPVTRVGMVMAVFGAGSVISQPLGGFLADRIGRRPTLAGGMIASGAAMLALGYAGGVPALVVAVFAAGVTIDLYRPASGALVADVVPAAERPRAFGLLYWAINLGFSVSTALGGFLARHGFTWLFWIDALTCIAFGLLIWRAIAEPDRPRASPVPDGPRRRGGEGFGRVLRDRVLLAYLGTAFGYLFVYLQAYTTLPLAMGRDHLSPAAYGVAIALNGVVIVVVQPLVIRRLSRYDRPRVLACGTVLAGLGFGLNALAGSAPAYAATVVVWTLGEIVVSAVGQTIVADLAPAHLRGRYQGMWGMAWSLAGLLAPLGGTYLLAQGKLVLWPVCAAITVAGGAGLLLLGPAIRRRAVDVNAEPAAAGR